MSFEKLNFLPFLFLLLIAMALCGPAHATKTVTSPYVHEGESAVEWKGGYEMEDGSNDNWEMEASVAHGVTSWWETELAVELEHDGGASETDVTGAAWENKFQLAPKGAFFVDPGLKIEYGKNLQGGPDEFQAKLLLAKQIGDFGNKANFNFGHELGEDAADDWEYGFAYALTYDYSEEFQFGAEWYSDFANFSGDFDDEGHQLGPVMYGEIGESVGYELGMLFGVSDAAPDGLVKAVIEYEF